MSWTQDGHGIVNPATNGYIAKYITSADVPAGEALVAAANRAEKLEAALWDDIGHGYVICHVCQVLYPNCPKAAEVYKIGEQVKHRDSCPLAETEVSE